MLGDLTQGTNQGRGAAEDRGQAQESNGAELRTSQMNRVRDCHVLSEAFGLKAEPYYQATDEGPEQEILFYKIDLLKHGIVMEYSEVWKALTKALPNPRVISLAGLGVDLSAESRPETGRHRHLATDLHIRKELAKDQNFLQLVESSAFQDAFSPIKECARNPEVANIAKDIAEHCQERTMADRKYCYIDDLATRLIPHV